MHADTKCLKGLQDNIVRARLTEVLGDDLADRFMTLFADIERLKKRDKGQVKISESAEGKGYAIALEAHRMIVAHLDQCHPELLVPQSE